MPTPEEDKIVHNFMHMMHQFLDALHEVYPACTHVGGYKLGLDTLRATHSGEALLRQWREAMEMYNDIMQPHYARCMQRDETLLSEDIKFLHDLGLYSKWGSMNPGTKETTWEFITHLNSLCCSRFVNKSMPPCVMNNFRQLSNNIIQKLQAGELSLVDLNPIALAAEFENMLSEEESEQMVQYGATLSDGGIDKHTLMNMMMSIAPGNQMQGVNLEAMTDIVGNVCSQVQETGEMPTTSDLIGNVMTTLK